jgi:hypothetical protein
MKMSRTAFKNVPLFYYLGILQFAAAFCGGFVSFIFIKFVNIKLFDWIMGFLPDVSMKTWSTIGLLMLAIQVFGNFAGVIFSFLRSESTGNIAMMVGGSEMLWMVFQYVVLHMHNTLMLLFFILAFGQVIIGYILKEKVKELKKVYSERSY